MRCSPTEWFLSAAPAPSSLLPARASCARPTIPAPCLLTTVMLRRNDRDVCRALLHLPGVLWDPSQDTRESACRAPEESVAPQLLMVPSAPAEDVSRASLS